MKITWNCDKFNCQTLVSQCKTYVTMSPQVAMNHVYVCVCVCLKAGLHRPDPTRSEATTTDSVANLPDSIVILVAVNCVVIGHIVFGQTPNLSRRIGSYSDATNTDSCMSLETGDFRHVGLLQTAWPLRNSGLILVTCITRVRKTNVLQGRGRSSFELYSAHPDSFRFQWYDLQSICNSCIYPHCMPLSCNISVLTAKRNSTATGKFT